MKITITDEVVVKFKALLGKLSERNPHIQMHVGPAILALVDYICEESYDALRESLATQLITPARRKKALIEGLKDLDSAGEKAALDALEKGLRRVKNQLHKPATAKTPGAS